MRDDNDLIAAIYDTIVDPSGWDAAIKRIVAATNSTSGALVFHKADTTHFTAFCDIDPFYANAYVESYSKISPLAAEAATIAPGEVRAGTRITQTDAFRASAFYNEFARPHMWTASDGKHNLVLRTTWTAAVICPAFWRRACLRRP